jgi:hypothetical protein
MEDGNWKLNLLLKSRRNHSEWSPRLSVALDKYINSNVSSQKPYEFLGHLVRACMDGGEDRILSEILKHENVESLEMQGPVGDNGWETFAKAMPNNLAIKKLSLRDFCFSPSEAEHFFRALGQMHALREMTLEQVSAKSTFFSSFSSVRCPPLELETLHAFAGFPASLDDDDCSLPLAILVACKLRSLSFEENGGSTVDQHKAWCKAIEGQVELESLQLKSAVSKDVLSCYMPFLSKHTPLMALDLSGFRLGPALLEVLVHNKPELKSLMLTCCEFQRAEGADCRSQFEHLSGLLKLETLDLSQSWLDDKTMVPLLSMIKKGMIGLLQHLHLNNNPVGAETIKALASLLAENRTLISVEMEHGAFFQNKEMPMLVEAIKHNTCLREITLPGPEYGGVWRDQVEPYLERNRQAFQAAVAGSVEPVVDVIRDDMPRDVHSNVRDLPTERDRLLNTEPAAVNYGSF